MLRLKGWMHVGLLRFADSGFYDQEPASWATEYT